jgi:probable HAF family extracellular repeat protein
MLCLLISGTAQAQGPWVPTDLGALRAVSVFYPLGNGRSLASAINDVGDVVGSTMVDGAGTDTSHAFVWTQAGGMIDLGTFGGANSDALDVNNSGVVVGWAENSAGHQRAFVWTSTSGKVDLGTLGGSRSWANGINDAGQVVGVSWLCDNCTPTGPLTRAFSWTPAGGIVDLGAVAPDRHSAAVAVNDAGHIIGLDSAGFSSRGIIWLPGQGITDVGSLGGSTYPRAINSAGTVVGASETSGGVLHPFSWTAAGGMVDLNPAGRFSSADGINDTGHIVGWNCPPRSQITSFCDGVVWTTAGRGIPLKKSVAAKSINRFGHVAGAGQPSAYGTHHGFVWKPEAHQLAVNFGAPHGIWGLDGATWTPIHGRPAEGLVVGDLDLDDRSDLVIDFGPSAGTWIRKNQGAWTQAHPLSTGAMAIGNTSAAIGVELLADFGSGTGIWWNNALSFWFPVHAYSPSRMITAAMRRFEADTLIVVFPGLGVWTSQQGTWRHLHPLDPSVVAAADIDNDGGDDVIFNFPGWGLWTYLNDSTWVQLHGRDATRVAAGDIDGNGETDLVIDFGASVGLWTFRNNAAWVPLHGLSSKSIVLADRNASGRDEVVIDFGQPYGVWQYADDSTWNQVHPLSPQSVAAGRIRW